MLVVCPLCRALAQVPFGCGGPAVLGLRGRAFAVRSVPRFELPMNSGGRTSNLASRSRTVILALLVATLCYLSARLAGSLAISIPQTIWPLWPGCAVLVGVLLLVPRKIWPVLLPAGLVGFVFYDLQAGVSIPSIAWLILADILEILVAAWGVTYFLNGKPRLNSLRALATYSFFTVFLASLVVSSIGSHGLSGDLWLSWKFSFLSEALAFLTVTPAIIGLFGQGQPPLRTSLRYYLEAALLVSTLVFLGYFLFLAPGRRDPPSLLYSLVPFLIWSALRFGSAGVGSSATIVALMSIWGAVHGRGPFTEIDPINRVLALQLFLFCTSIPFMVLAVLVEERKITQDELRESEERLRLSMDSGKAVGWEWDLKTGRDSWFGDLKNMFGIPSEGFVGRAEDFYRYVHPDDRNQVSQAVADARNNHQPYAEEFRVVWPDGTVRWIAATGRFYYAATGLPERMLGMALDITDRKRSQEELRKSEERLRLAIQAGKMFVCDWDAIADLFTHSPESAQILGSDQVPPITSQEVVGSVHPEDRDKFTAAAAGLSPEKPDLMLSYRMVRPDGSLIWLERNSRAHFDDQGKLVRITGIVTDITERKRSEEALRASEERLRLAVQAGKMFAYEWVAATDMLVRSAESANILGIDPSVSLTGQQILARVHPDDREGLTAAVASLSPAKPKLAITYRMFRPDGSLIWVERNSQAHFDDQGSLLRIVGIVADITERKRAEEALRESEGRFRLVANTAPMLIWMSDTNKLCTYFNDSWLAFTGRPMELELGNGWAEGVHPEDLQRCLNTYNRAFDARQTFKMEYRLRRRDGEYRSLLDIGVPRFNQGGSFAGYIGSCVDVSERKLAEDTLSSVNRKLIEAQERERSRIARELHDDVGQRLALLTVELEQLWQTCSDLPPALLQRIDKLRGQSSDIASDVQSLSHELHSSKLEYLGIATAMRAFCHELSAQQNVEVLFVHDEVPRTISQDISLCLFRVAQEALQNAVKHSGVRRFEVELRYAPDALHLTVRDSGAGFDVTGSMKSTGLGLISMAERLKLVDGQLSIDSRPHHGTTIRARVPISKAARASA
jgi:PAS domain S-box-containing protein